MTKIPLDHVQDIDAREAHRLLTLCPAPEFVKTASPARLNGDESLPRHLYADPKNKLYPCHTAPATWMSALFFADKQSQFNEKAAQEIKSRIYKAAEYFGLLGDLPAFEKTASAEPVTDDDFAVVWLDAAGNKERHWPIRNANEVKFAAAHFAKYRDEFVFADRHRIAEKILEKAAQFETDLGDTGEVVSVSAGFGLCAAKTAAELLQTRAQLVRRTHADAAAQLTKLAAVVISNPEVSRRRDTLLKLAEVVDAVDRETKLYRLYDAGGLTRPEETLFAVTEKVARDFLAQNVETTTGNVYALDDLEKLAVDDIRDWLGDDIADALSSGGVYIDRDKLAAVVPTLDRGAAATLDRLMAEKKACAVVRSQATDDLLSLDRLYELAAQQ